MGSVCEHCGLETDKLLYECNWCGLSVCEACRLPEKHDCDGGPVGGDTPQNASPEAMKSGSIMRDYTRRKDQPGYGSSEPSPKTPTAGNAGGPGLLRRIRSTVAGTIKLYAILTILVVGVLGGATVLYDAIDDGTVEDTIDGVVDELDQGVAAVDNDTSSEGEVVTGDAIRVFDVEKVEEEFHQLLNGFRTDRGVPPLSYDEYVGDVATGHSEDMATNDYFRHENQAGESPGDRINDGPEYCSLVAENIAQTWWDQLLQDGTVIDSEADLARQLFTMWRNSSGHRENMVSELFDSHGLGIAVTDEGEIYATNDFCG